MPLSSTVLGEQHHFFGLALRQNSLFLTTWFSEDTNSKETGMDAKKHPNARYKFAVRRERWLVLNVARWAGESECGRGEFARCAINRSCGSRFTMGSTLPSATVARRFTAIHGTWTSRPSTTAKSVKRSSIASSKTN